MFSHSRTISLSTQNFCSFLGKSERNKYQENDPEKITAKRSGDKENYTKRGNSANSGNRSLNDRSLNDPFGRDIHEEKAQRPRGRYDEDGKSWAVGGKKSKYVVQLESFA